MTLSTSVSPSHPSDEEDDDTRIRISNKVYGGSRSVPTMSLSISISPSHRSYEVDNGDTIIFQKARSPYQLWYWPKSLAQTAHW